MIAMMEDLLTLEEVARTLNLSVYTVRKYINQGRLEGVMLVGRWRVRPEALRSFVVNRIKPETDKK